MSRNEELLQALINDSTVDIKPQSRAEAYLKACCNCEGTDCLPVPISRNDVLLYELAEKISEESAKTVSGNTIYINNAAAGTAKVSVSENCDIDVRNKNVFNATYIGNPSELYNPIVRGYISLNQGDEFTISFDTENTGVQCYINTNSGFSESYFFCNGNRQTITLTATESKFNEFVTLISLGEAKEAGTISNIQIEKGSVATEFIACVSQQYTLATGTETTINISEGTNNIFNDNNNAILNLTYKVGG